MIVRQLIRFGLVGLLATAIHICIGILLVHIGWSALWANASAFGVAFFVSFTGHFGYSFADLQSDPNVAFRRFASVAVGGFALNEIMLVLLLSQTVLPPMLALALSTLCAAIVTFGLCRAWAFSAQRNSQAPS